MGRFLTEDGKQTTGHPGPSGPYAVHFDASACAGCKACQAACKDHNGLEGGLLWRRVYEIAGGGWEREGGAWRQDVFGYFLSLSCNHCERPICAEVCPAGAYEKRADGAVILDSRKCVGCRYCEWACPYGAPRYDERNGWMTKCTLCADRLDEGLQPSCVCACPMRALDFGPREELERRYGEAECFPLPEARLTRPLLRVTPHAEAGRARPAGRVVNGEEVGA
jgi:anaerobic dimethyl sulfoxide reductase subunit B (iron-sulfur subunit)